MLGVRAHCTLPKDGHVCRGSGHAFLREACAKFVQRDQEHIQCYQVRSAWVGSCSKHHAGTTVICEMLELTASCDPPSPLRPSITLLPPFSCLLPRHHQVGLFSLGIIPYINASIVLQLFSAAFPGLKKMQRDEGAQVRRTYGIKLGLAIGVSKAGVARKWKEGRKEESTYVKAGDVWQCREGLLGAQLRVNTIARCTDTARPCIRTPTDLPSLLNSMASHMNAPVPAWRLNPADSDPHHNQP